MSAPLPLATRLPLVTTEVAVGGRRWRVTAAPNPEAIYAMADVLGDFPHGFLLWESGVALAQNLADHPELVSGKRVLELGAGVGLPGLVAHALGGQVMQTDFLEDLLTLGEINARQNGVPTLPRFQADWTAWNHPDRYDVILGADILYERTLHDALEQIFHRNLVPGGTLLLTDPGRAQGLELAARLEGRGWEITLAIPAEVTIMTCSPPR